MAEITTAFNDAFRDFTVDGMASTGKYYPAKSAIRAIGPVIEGQLADLNAIATGGIKWLPTASGVIRVRSTANVDITTALENGDTLNGVTLATGNHVFLPYQTAPAQNGLYTVGATGAAPRAAFANSAAELERIGFVVQEGAAGAGEQWSLPMSAAEIVLGTTPLTFSMIGIGAGTTTAEVVAARDGQPALLDNINLAKFAGSDFNLDSDEGVTLDLAAQTYVSRSLANLALSSVLNTLAGKVTTVRSTTKFVTTKTGLLASVAIDTNTFEYAGQGERPIGMTVFPISDSKIHYSDVNGLWTPTRLTAAANNAAGPDGVVNATLLTPDGTNNNHFTTVTSSSTFVISDYRCLSVYVKRPSGTANVRLSSAVDTGVVVNADYNLTTGAITVSGATALTGIQRLNSGWWRIWLAHTSATYNYMQASLWVLDSSMNFVHTSTQPLLVVKARVDLGRAPIYPVDFGHSTLYPTTGADLPKFTLTGTPGALARGIGTVTAIAFPSEDGVDYGRVLLQIDAGDDNNCIRLTNGAAGNGSLRAQVISAGSVIATTVVAPATSAAARFRVAVAWNESGLRLSVNGVEVSALLATMPQTAYTTLRIGHRAAGDLQWFGAIEKITITPRELTHVEIWGAAAGAGASDAVVLVATGQSNMFGSRTGGDLTTNQNVFAWDNVQIKWVVANLAGNPFGPAFGASVGSNNLSFHAAKRIQEKTGKRVYLVLHAWAGQPIRKWVKVAERPFWDVINPEATAALAAIGRTYCDAFLWHQGEGDSNNLRTTGTLGPAIGDTRPEHPSEHLYRTALLQLVALVQASAWGSTEHTRFLFGELVQGGTNGVNNFTDDRNDVLSNAARYGSTLLSVPSYGLTTDVTLHHFDGAGLEQFGHRYADVFLGLSVGNNCNPADDLVYRRRERITTNTDAVPVHVGQRNCLLWARSATATSATADPLNYAIGARGVVFANLGQTGEGNLTVKPGTSRIFNAGGTLNPTSIVLTPGQKVELECIADGAPGTAQAWQVLP